MKTATPSNTTFKVAGLRDNKSGAINGDIEAKYTDKKNGLVFTQAWTTSNVLRSQLELSDYVTKGLKLDLSTALLPDKGQKSALINATYKQPGLHSRAFLDLFKVSSPSERVFTSMAAICGAWPNTQRRPPV